MIKGPDRFTPPFHTYTSPFDEYTPILVHVHPLYTAYLYRRTKHQAPSTKHSNCTFSYLNKCRNVNNRWVSGLRIVPPCAYRPASCETVNATNAAASTVRLKVGHQLNCDYDSRYFLLRTLMIVPHDQPNTFKKQKPSAAQDDRGLICETSADQR